MTDSVKSKVSSEEWQTRVDLAACYRAVAMYGWDDLIFTHISARVPFQPHLHLQLCYPSLHLPLPDLQLRSAFWVLRVLRSVVHRSVSSPHDR